MGRVTGMKRFYMALMVLVFFVFTITAQTRGGELEIVDAGGTVVGRFGEAHALVIGESEYTNGWGRLPGV